MLLLSFWKKKKNINDFFAIEAVDRKLKKLSGRWQIDKRQLRMLLEVTLTKYWYHFTFKYLTKKMDSIS